METIEIKNFNLLISYSQYWISYEVNGDNLSYPVIISPYNLIKLFEVEGVYLNNETDDLLKGDGINFNKAIFIRYKHNKWGDLQNEEGGDATAQECWVKLQ